MNTSNLLMPDIKRAARMVALVETKIDQIERLRDSKKLVMTLVNEEGEGVDATHLGRFFDNNELIDVLVSLLQDANRKWTLLHQAALVLSDERSDGEEVFDEDE
jgi:predicted FMN-binding regulatory protein PaiB